jgi:cobalamin biosynthesis Mg chelatase CobN
VDGHSGQTRQVEQGHGQYLKLVDRLPGILKFVPTAGALTDAKHYLYLFCYFLQPTPANIQSMLLYSLVHYVRDERLKKIRVPKPEQMPSVAIYHPERRRCFGRLLSIESGISEAFESSESTIGLLLMRPQVISKTTNITTRLSRNRSRRT